MTAKITYVLTWADSQSENDTDVVIYGPFTTLKEATEWGERWQEANGDDPSWNTVWLYRKKVGGGVLPVPVLEPIEYMK